MISGASGSEQSDIMVPSHDRKITPERIRIRNHVRTLFRAEDAVHQDGGMGVGHANIGYRECPAYSVMFGTSSRVVPAGTGPLKMPPTQDFVLG